MDISLIETLLYEPGVGLVRLERHLARLERSAQALGLGMPKQARDALTAAVTSAETSLRVRLELFGDKRMDVQTAAFVPLAANATWRLKIASTRLSSGDPLLRHKTSRRAVYTAARAEAPASEADEMLLLNERDELCEGTITSLFLDDGSGILKTPPLPCGLLAGVLREELLESGQATEAVLRPEDLRKGTVFVGNSLRGIIRATLV